MSQLRTTWVCIATEGETVDGREILRNEIIEMAETYDYQRYTAMIWYLHPPNGKHVREPGEKPVGEVIEVKAEEDDAGTLHLYAILRPFIRLLEMNAQDYGLFPSVEMNLDFQGQGITYLEGLAVVDDPACVGTTRFNFSRKRDKGNGSMKDKSWHKMFGIEEPAPEPEKKSEEPAKLQVLAEVLAELESKFSTLKMMLTETQQSVEEVKEDVETVKEVVDTEDFSKLRDNLPNIVKNFSKLDSISTRKPSANPTGNKNKRFDFL
ncbi:GPO family capsid scaffolding protein [Proteus penneri]|uniref:GPO family capsid scaffolding protein n=1 Tax=Proteus penneri TaxID=102862 RepID=UPI00288C40AC|nr:GPO family capsid scaffolding protein [Proteus penneri]